MGAKASKASQAKDRQIKLDKLAKLQEASKALLIGEQRKPALTLARPPACGMAPLSMGMGDAAYASGVDLGSHPGTPKQPEKCDLACGVQGH